MTCEEFAIAGLDLGSETEDSPLQQAARAHLRNCPHCAALHEQWQTLRADLHLLAHETSEATTPARVEMRLRQDFRTKHKTMRARRAAVTATWALAAAAVLVAAGSWIHWRQEQHRAANLRNSPTAQVAGVQMSGLQQDKSTGADLGETITASNDSGDFTLLPGRMPSAMEDAMVVRVGMQRAALGALGLTVNEERAGDWIQVDLLIGDDGLPQAVRLPQTSDRFHAAQTPLSGREEEKAE